MSDDEYGLRPMDISRTPSGSPRHSPDKQRTPPSPKKKVSPPKVPEYMQGRRIVKGVRQAPRKSSPTEADKKKAARVAQRALIKQKADAMGRGIVFGKGGGRRRSSRKSPKRRTNASGGRHDSQNK